MIELEREQTLVTRDSYTITTSDGIKLSATNYIPHANPRATIFISHGFTVPSAGPANILADTATALAENGYMVVTWDYRGHGQSGGNDYDVTLDTFRTDFDAVFRHNRPDAPFGVLGFSVGAMTVINYFADQDVQPTAMVLYSPALDMWNGSFNHSDSALGGSYQAVLKNGDLDRNSWFIAPSGFHVGRGMVESAKNLSDNAAKNLDKLRAKTLIIQGAKDQMLNYQLMRRLGEGKVDKYIVLDTVHGLTEQKDQAIALTADWFDQYLGDEK
jgi:alpha-beta hydrolase superfamily lysophospholipase